MIAFPPCKINLGLNVVARRADGYHDLETSFFPLNWCDALEVIRHPENEAFRLVCTGDPIPEGGDNLIKKAWKALSAIRQLPPVLVHLLKKIPMGAGLGGGSSDAAHFLRLMNGQFELQLNDSEIRNLATGLGSDCAFFLHDKPMLGKGKGDELTPLEVSLEAFYIMVVYTGIHSSTAEAYSNVRTARHKIPVSEVLEMDPVHWRTMLVNDFETGIFKRYPQLAVVKERLYEHGAVYASMSGSGSAVFGLFNEKPAASFPAEYRVHVQAPAGKIL